MHDDFGRQDDELLHKSTRPIFMCEECHYAAPLEDKDKHVFLDHHFCSLTCKYKYQARREEELERLERQRKRKGKPWI